MIALALPSRLYLHLRNASSMEGESGRIARLKLRLTRFFDLSQRSSVKLMVLFFGRWIEIK
jgi:hypothetical protein